VQVDAGQLGVVIEHLFEVTCTTQYAFYAHRAAGAR
jgi:hypothetical protein